MKLRIFGRSSSHFTRVVRVFAHELSVAHDFSVVLDLFSQASADYGDNPALRLPVLVTHEGPWFGALSICQELARQSATPRRIVWPAQLTRRLSANAQELVTQGMATEVGIIMRSVGASGPVPYDGKARESLVRSLAWLDREAPSGRLTEIDAVEALEAFRVETGALRNVSWLFFRISTVTSSSR